MAKLMMWMKEHVVDGPNIIGGEAVGAKYYEAYSMDTIGVPGDQIQEKIIRFAMDDAFVIASLGFSSKGEPDCGLGRRFMKISNAGASRSPIIMIHHGDGTYVMWHKNPEILIAEWETILKSGLINWEHFDLYIAN